MVMIWLQNKLLRCLSLFWLAEQNLEVKVLSGWVSISRRLHLPNKPKIKWLIHQFEPSFLTWQICAFVLLGYNPGNPKNSFHFSEFLHVWTANVLMRPRGKAAVPVCKRLHHAHTAPLCSAGRRPPPCQWNETFGTRSNWTVPLRCLGPSRWDQQGSGSCSQQKNFGNESQPQTVRQLRQKCCFYCAPVDDQVVSQAALWWRLVGGPAGLGHQRENFIVHLLCLELHPDSLVQLDAAISLDGFGSKGIRVSHHAQREVPLSGGNLLLDGAERELWIILDTFELLLCFEPQQGDQKVSARRHTCLWAWWRGPCHEADCSGRRSRCAPGRDG